MSGNKLSGVLGLLAKLNAATVLVTSTTLIARRSTMPVRLGVRYSVAYGLRDAEGACRLYATAFRLAVLGAKLPPSPLTDRLPGCRRTQLLATWYCILERHQEQKSRVAGRSSRASEQHGNRYTALSYLPVPRLIS